MDDPVTGGGAATLERDVRRQLEEAFQPEALEIADESHRHVGHGATGAHLRVTLVSERFAGRSMVERHRLVYEALQGLLPGPIHALRLQTLSPSEAAAAG